MSSPVAVLISDVHYSVHNLELADKSVRMAIAKANELQVPLIVAGDLHDTKANLRGECVNAMLETFKLLENDCYILRGNHDSINEKSKYNSLDFLDKVDDTKSIAVINTPTFVNWLSINGKSLQFIPYEHDVNELRKYLKIVDKGSCIIMHQGLEGSNSGDYIQDKSALRHEDVQDFRVISGHYHTRQDIKMGRPQKGAIGLFSYIGNPYTLNFGEARDPLKGFQVLYGDGSLEFVPTNLRKHVVIELNLADLPTSLNKLSNPNNFFTHNAKKGDETKVKLHGPKARLFVWKKENIGRILALENFKLEFVPTDELQHEARAQKNLTNAELFDSIIDALNTNAESKQVLKSTWKTLCE